MICEISPSLRSCKPLRRGLSRSTELDRSGSSRRLVYELLAERKGGLNEGLIQLERIVEVISNGVSDVHLVLEEQAGKVDRAQIGASFLESIPAG